jgi:Tfp pilus assembly protein FimT
MRFPRRALRVPVGFTLIEMLIIVVMMMLLGMIAIPRVKLVKDRLNVNGARDEIAAAIATARAAAIQKGRPSLMVVRSNAVSVYATTSATGTLTRILGPIRLDSVYHVSVVPTSSSDTAITFESRGFASPKLSTSSRYVITGLVKKDSLCVSTTGQILPRGCTL